jgi:hypothetical protein
MVPDRPNAPQFHKVQYNHSLSQITWPAEPYTVSSDTAKQHKQHSERSTDSLYLARCNQVAPTAQQTIYWFTVSQTLQPSSTNSTANDLPIHRISDAATKQHQQHSEWSTDSLYLRRCNQAAPTAQWTIYWFTISHKLQPSLLHLFQVN